MTYAIRTHQLTKGYRGKDVVSNVSMNVKRGEIYGFLGPNGAGKTTIMKMMTSLIKPTAGDIEVLGTRLQANSHEVLKRIGCRPERIWKSIVNIWATTKRMLSQKR